MLWSEREHFSRAAAGAFLRVLGAALLACVAADALLGAWRVHAGELFPWRHLPGIPLYGHAMLSLEWALGGLAGALLVVGAGRQVALPAALLATAMGLTQRYSNHRALLFIVLVFVALEPIDLDDPEAASVPRPALALVRLQLLVVYVSSVLNKVLDGFPDGRALSSLFGWQSSRPLAWGVLVAELLVPALLVLRPRWGLLSAIALHVAMAVLLPSVWPFSLTMIAMAILFVK